MVAAIGKLNAPMLTTSRVPVSVSTPLGRVKAIMFRDPNGYIVEAVQAPVPDGAPAAGNVIGAIMGVTVEDMSLSLKFWHDQLGFDFTADQTFRPTRRSSISWVSPRAARSERCSVSCPGAKPGSR